MKSIHGLTAVSRQPSAVTVDRTRQIAPPLASMDSGVAGLAAAVGENGGRSDQFGHPEVRKREVELGDVLDLRS